eukprot:Nitzschia sp. Nitz4//scaffold191_size41780//17798//19268//NITZ4_007467-RA/size41780-processed-gene-0.80-mRNA-1//-1//CDS//3329540181//3501//frame0
MSALRSTLCLVLLFFRVSSYVTDDRVDSDLPWADVPMAPPDAILGISQAFRESTQPNKVNVCVGAYRDDKGDPWVLQSVRKAEEKLLTEGENKEYLPIEGDQEFVQLALKFAYGADVDLDRIAGIQALSGTGACRVGGEFLARFFPDASVYIPVPTWGNHWTIFQKAGLDTKPYRYYDHTSNRLDMEGMLADLEEAPKGSIVLLHVCAHNPTGSDPSEQEWEQILQLIKTKKLIAFFDSAYQGFASGDAEADAKPLRMAVDEGIPVLLAQSFAKNFGLYGERCGTLSVVCRDNIQRDIVMSQLKGVVRPMYSSPPKHGSSIVRTVLSDPHLSRQYYKECETMALRIQKMREQLALALAAAGSLHDWSHVTNQIGMFAYTGMSPEMCDRLTSDYAIYLTKNGRISVAGLNAENIEYVAKAIHDVTHGRNITSGY